MENDQKKLNEAVNRAHSIVFFGGAGVSTESGIPDFRSEGRDEPGLPPEIALSAGFFKADTKAFYAYYFSKMVHLHAKPNAAHMALARLEAEGKLKAVITQNIDGLHQAAGSESVIELHGSVKRNHCINCKAFYTLGEICENAPLVPLCKCGGVIKPDVVLYGEQLPEGAMEKAARFVQAADMLVVGGTSLSVYPAAGLLGYFTGETLVIVNRQPTAHDRYANIVMRGSIGEVFERLWEA